MSLHDDAVGILQAGLTGVDPAARVAEALADEPELSDWAGSLAAGEAGRRVLVAVGKAALGMARGALGVLGDALDGGLVVVPAGVEGEAPRPEWLPASLELFAGGHPLPTPGGLAAARRVAELLDALDAGDRLLVLLSGGGSSLLTLPAGRLELDDLRRTTELMLRAGFPIEDLNRVRKHLEVLKGGGLASLAAPAPVLGLLLSDVPGDPPEVIASGPLSPESSRFRDVEVLLRRRGLWNELPPIVRRHLRAGREGRHAELPRAGDPVFRDVRLRVVAGGGRALTEAARAARACGYSVHVLTDRLRGEARAAGRGLVRVARAVRDEVGPVRAPACILAAGETTVEVRGPGRGGRNQEVALGAALALEGTCGIVVASLGTDGVDGPTDAAGGWADGDTVARGRALGLDAATALAANDAYPFLKATGGLLVTGPTGTNVADLMVVLVTGAEGERAS